jgi:predicted HD superfamily hydrolase involved in NAD metabolism
MSELPPPLQARLDALPAGLQAHISRVREIARALAVTHGINGDLADLTAAAHDVARHLPGRQLIEEAERLGVSINNVERQVPILLHGPVGAGWLRNDGGLSDRDALEGVHWHTTAHPDLAPVGQVVFIADKLDPHKAKSYPFQAEVREAAEQGLADGVLMFLDHSFRAHLERGELLHPMSTDTRNSILLSLSC